MKTGFFSLLVLLLVFSACKKEQTQKIANLSTNAVNLKQTTKSIPAAAISLWFATHKIGNYLIPDWSKAEQTVVDGVAAVKVPIMSIYNAKTTEGVPRINSLKSFSQDTVEYTDTQHPAMLYFFSNDDAPQDSVTALLMNFLPNDRSKENGENNIWTGKLIEWGMNSDVVNFQVINKSYATDKGTVKLQTLNTSLSVKKPVENSVKVTTIFADIWNALKTFVEAIGWFLGVPGNYNYYETGTKTWCDFLGGIFCGGGGGDSGSGVGGGGSVGTGSNYWITGGPAYNMIYSGYLAGYNGTNSGNWTPYSDGSGGGNPQCPGMPVASVSGQVINRLEGCPVYTPPPPPPAPAVLVKPNLDENFGSDYLIFSDPTSSVVYQEYQNQQAWPTIDRIIAFDSFVPMRFENGLAVSCLTLSREQLAKAGYTCSGYLPNSQTFQTYTEAGGVDLSRTRQAITYMIDALSHGIPIIAGVDNHTGSVNFDKSTDHYIVINGMGTDSQGKYFQFIDNSTSDKSAGANYANRLYYDSVTGKISGSTQSTYGSYPNYHKYIITQVRKSIKQ